MQYQPFLEIEDVLLSESINIKLLNRLAFAIINEDQANTPDSRSAPSTETKTAYKRKSFHKPPLPSVTAEVGIQIFMYIYVCMFSLCEILRGKNIIFYIFD